MSEEQDIGVLANMYREQPGMVRTMFPVGIDYPIEDGDTLVSIAERFGLPWQRVAAGALAKFAEDGEEPSFMAGMTIRIPKPEVEWENSFAPLEPDTILNLWTTSPATAALLFPDGLPYPVGDDDSLKSLAEQFNLPWEAIAEATMGSSDGGDINSWLEENGGRKLPSGWWAFADGMQVVIPAPEIGDAPDIDGAIAALSNLTGDALA